MIIGGENGGARKQTYFVDMNNNAYTNGPNLLAGRYYFACHTMKVNGEDFIIATGGSGSSGSGRSTEYLQRANWKSGWKRSKN